MSLNPDYLEDAILLSELLSELQANQRQIGLQLLRPYIESFVAENPQVENMDRIPMMMLRNYLQE